jgi:hypothetical protein
VGIERHICFDADFDARISKKSDFSLKSPLLDTWYLRVQALPKKRAAVANPLLGGVA